MKISVATFYKFVAIDAPERLQANAAACAAAHDLRGTILIAREGINATISGSSGQLAAFLTWLRSDRRFADIVAKESLAGEHPFKRLKVKVKPEIVSLGQPDIDPVNDVGIYVAPDAWNALIQSPDVVVIDTRNSYEFAIGSFRGAVDPKTRSFREFPLFVETQLDPARHRKVAMFCTGGIRCEKATAFLRRRGFEEVYHLEGGILKYLEAVSPENSLWQGECFIFDQRVALGHGVRLGHHSLCATCGYPVARQGFGKTAHCANCQRLSGGLSEIQDASHDA